MLNTYVFLATFFPQSRMNSSKLRCQFVIAERYYLSYTNSNYHKGFYIWRNLCLFLLDFTCFASVSVFKSNRSLFCMSKCVFCIILTIKSWIYFNGNIMLTIHLNDQRRVNFSLNFKLTKFNKVKYWNVHFHFWYFIYFDR